MGWRGKSRVGITVLAFSLAAFAAPPTAAATIAWSTLPGAAHTGTISSDLYGVSCVSPSFCVAVGIAENGDTTTTLIESWNGTAWAIMPSPNVGTQDSLHAVSCVSATFCVAVGSTNTVATVIETLDPSVNGLVWNVVPSPSPGTKNVLTAVSCLSATFCEAVGTYFNGTVSLTLVESWNGKSWVVVPSANPPGNMGAFLTGVSCVSTTACTAVGTYSVSVHFPRTLIETFVHSVNGPAWKIVPSPDPDNFNELLAASCLSSSSCTAVGVFSSAFDNPYQTLIESWDGASWSVVPSPNPEPDDGLQGVSCVSASFCASAGIESSDGIIPQTLIESWDGTAWSVVPSPNAGTKDSLYGISCASASFCMAVGDYVNVTIDQTLIEGWDGSAWRIVPSPNPIADS